MARPTGSSADDWNAFLDEHKEALPYVAVQIAEAIKALEKQVYVPGLWRCPKCKFNLMQANLNASDGTVSSRDTPGDKCPNCHGPLWRVSERQAGNEALDRCEAAVNELRDANTALASSNYRVLAELRANGWSVGVHNDYRLNGVQMTFWLMTHECGLYLKGEGKTDADALHQIDQQARKTFAPSP